jgi:aconitate hydratase
MGILPLRLPEGTNPQSLALKPGDRIEIDADSTLIVPRCEINVRVVRADGKIEPLRAIAAIETQLEAELLRDGGVIPSILKKTISEQTGTPRLPVMA